MTVREFLAQNPAPLICPEYKKGSAWGANMEVDEAWKLCDNATWMCYAASISPHCDDIAFRQFILDVLDSLTKEQRSNCCGFLNLFHDLPTIADQAYAMCLELVGRNVRTNQQLAKTLRRLMPDFIL